MSDIMAISPVDTTPLSPKPKLTQLQTPQTSTFPSELSARSPLPGYADVIKHEGLKTPITPPLAYTDFLKTMNSPVVLEKSLSPGPLSAPSSVASTEHSECSCSCTCESHNKSPSSTPITPFTYPSSAPTSSRLSRILIPASPSVSDMATPTSAIRSPFSARSTRSPYDWNFKTKGRYFEGVGKPGARSSVRHVREVVTRTVTYTPRMCPAPKGKKKRAAE